MPFDVDRIDENQQQRKDAESGTDLNQLRAMRRRDAQPRFMLDGSLPDRELRRCGIAKRLIHPSYMSENI